NGLFRRAAADIYELARQRAHRDLYSKAEMGKGRTRPNPLYYKTANDPEWKIRRKDGLPAVNQQEHPAPIPTMRLILGDCLDRMAEISEHSVDLILTDMPFGNKRVPGDEPID